MTEPIDPFRLKLFNQQKNGWFCDVTLIATMDGTRVPVHRCVLFTASEFFENLLKSDMKEKHSEEITLGDVSGEVLKRFVDYWYTQQITITKSNVHDFLAAAHLFRCLDLVQLCENVYLEAIDATNAVSILEIAKRYNLNKCQQTAQTFIHEQFFEFIENEEYLHFGAEKVAEYLGSQDIFNNTEEDIFDAIIKWIEYDPVERTKDYASLMKTVRMSKIENAFLNCHIQEVSDKLGMHNVFEEARREKYEQKAKLTDVDRKSNIKYVYATGKAGRRVLLARYTIATNKWGNIRTLHHARNCNFHCINNIFYLFEKEVAPKHHKKQISCMPLSAKSRQPTQSSIQDKSEFATVAVGQYVYLIGGTKDSNCAHILSDVQRYDTRKDTLSDMTPLNKQRSGAAATVLAGKIYVVGGRTEPRDVSSKSVERYDREKNQWTFVADLNEARAYHSCCMTKGIIFAVGGYTESESAGVKSRHTLSSIEKYDAQIDKWTVIEAEIHIPRCRFGLGVLGNWIYIAGGEREIASGLKDFQKVNVVDGRIVMLSSMSEPYFDLSCVMGR